MEHEAISPLKKILLNPIIGRHSGISYCATCQQHQWKFDKTFFCPPLSDQKGFHVSSVYLEY